MVMFIGLNPSTANAVDDDPTIRRVKRFANDWGFGGVYMMNLFAFITPYPTELSACEDPLGDNDGWLEKIGEKCERVVFAWGAFKEAAERAEDVAKKFPHGLALVINKDGTPRHPLYVKADVELVKFNPLLSWLS